MKATSTKRPFTALTTIRSLLLIVVLSMPLSACHTQPRDTEQDYGHWTYTGRKGDANDVTRDWMSFSVRTYGKKRERLSLYILYTDSSRKASPHYSLEFSANQSGCPEGNISIEIIVGQEKLNLDTLLPPSGTVQCRRSTELKDQNAFTELTNMISTARQRGESQLIINRNGENFTFDLNDANQAIARLFKESEKYQKVR